MNATRSIEDEVVTLCETGHAEALRGRLEEAVRQYERAVSLDPGCGAAHFKRGTLLLRGDPARARRAPRPL